MPPYEIPDKIDEAFVQSLVDRKQPEDKHFELKRQLDIKSDRVIRTMLERASAFANTEGGFLIYGIEEFEGKAKSICGIDCQQNDDVLRQSIESHIRHWVDSDLVDVDIVPVTMESGKRVLVLHVPKSQSIPHMVTHSGQNRIYKRHSSGIYPPGLEELRQMFVSSVSSETIESQVQKLHDERIRAILADDSPMELQPGPKFVVLVIPASAVDTGIQLDLSALPNLIFNVLTDNNEGLIEENTHSYHQVFRNGCVEYAESYFPDVDNNKIPITNLELGARHCFLPRAFGWLKALNASLPCFVMLNLLNIKGYKLALSYDLERNARRLTNYLPRTERNRPYRKDHLQIQAVITDTLVPDIDALIHPAIYKIWNAFQYPRSPNYNDNNKWRGPNP